MKIPTLDEQALVHYVQVPTDPPSRPALIKLRGKLTERTTGQRQKLVELEELKLRLTPEGNTRVPRDLEVRLQAVEHDMSLVRFGVRSTDGYTDPDLADQIGQPGMADCEARLKQIDALLADAPKPLPELRVLARYTGRPLKHEVDGQLLVPGDTVQLTAHQLAAFGDRFEAVMTSD